MPWFPDFVSAAELARARTRADGREDPVGRYFAALTDGDPGVLEAVWPGEVVVHDPRAGEVRGHRRLREFVLRNRDWLAERQARIETTATTSAGGRAVVELVAHLDGDTSWPVAVVADCPDERSVVFRTYCSQWPVDGRHHLRPPILPPQEAGPGDVVGRLQRALEAGDTDAAMETFAPDGYLRGPLGTRRDAAALRSYLRGSTDLKGCAVTDDGVRCAVEYNCDRWGGRDLPPQAGVGVFERGPDGLLTAVRIYDDVDRP
jgi:SnoaL-like protein